MTATRTDSDIVRQFQIVAGQMACSGLSVASIRNSEGTTSFLVNTLRDGLETVRLYETQCLKELCAWYEGYTTDHHVD